MIHSRAFVSAFALALLGAPAAAAVKPLTTFSDVWACTEERPGGTCNSSGCKSLDSVSIRFTHVIDFKNKTVSAHQVGQPDKQNTIDNVAIEQSAFNTVVRFNNDVIFWMILINNESLEFTMSSASAGRLFRSVGADFGHCAPR